MTGDGSQSRSACGHHERGGRSPNHEAKESGAGNGCPISPSCSWQEGGVCLHLPSEEGTKMKSSGLL